MIDDLPDDVLLDIFDFYVACDGWRWLVHVCHRWRNLVFSSPRRLGLELLCKHHNRVRDMLHIWPALPMYISASYLFSPGPSPAEMDNVLAALEHSSRVSTILLGEVPMWALERFTAAMQVPFPELTVLKILSRDEEYRLMPILQVPDSLLGGSAPRLRSLELNSIPPRKLLLSISHLVELSLGDFPRYISPKVIVACLSLLKRLETLRVAFQSSQSRSDWVDRLSPPPPTRVTVPVLAELSFYGPRQYLEDLVAQIDTPLLNDLIISFFRDTISDIPHLCHFLSRTNELNMFSAAEIEFTDTFIRLELNKPHHLVLTLDRFFPIRTDWGRSSLASICSQLSPFLSHTERLDLICFFSLSETGMKNVNATEFLELFRPFTAVQSLYMFERLVAPVVPALLGLIGESTSEVLPNLRGLEIPEEAPRPFAAGWQLSGPQEPNNKSLKMAFFGYTKIRVYTRSSAKPE